MKASLLDSGEEVPVRKVVSVAGDRVLLDVLEEGVKETSTDGSGVAKRPRYEYVIPCRKVLGAPPKSIQEARLLKFCRGFRVKRHHNHSVDSTALPKV